jgi:DNA replication and repair protein RecF
MLKSLALAHFRSHANDSFRFSDGLTVITGPNGIGKTNILEAIYIQARGSSFRGSDSEIVAHGEDWYKISAKYDAGQLRVVRFEPEKISAKKTFEILGVKKQRLAPTQKMPIVLFEPEDLRLIHGSPSRRREFLDRMCGALDPHYMTLLHRYERSLLQRNNLLKTGIASDDELFAWEVGLAQTGAAIIKARRELVWHINERITDVYCSIADIKSGRAPESVRIDYLFYEGQTSLEQQLLSLLYVSRYSDRLRGFTSVGPHRHDIVLTLGDTPADESASRGETRSIILALKFIEVALLQERFDEPPLLLLDDVFSELDSTRRAALLELAHTVQTIITTTEVREDMPKNALLISL